MPLVRLLLLIVILALTAGIEVQAANLVKVVKASKTYDAIKVLDNIDDIDFKEAETEYGEKQIVMTTTFDDSDLIDDIAKLFKKINRNVPDEVLKRFNLEKILKGMKISLVTTFTFNSDDKIKSYSSLLFNGSSLIEDLGPTIPSDLNITLATQLLAFGYFKDLNSRAATTFSKIVNQLLQKHIVILNGFVASEAGNPTFKRNSDILGQAGGNSFEISVLVEAAFGYDYESKLEFSSASTALKLDADIYYNYTDNKVKDLIIDFRKNGTHQEISVGSGLDFPVVIADSKTTFILLPDKCVFGEKRINGRDMTGPELEVADEEFARAYREWKKKNKTGQKEETEEQQEEQVQERKDDASVQRKDEEPVAAPAEADIDLPVGPFTEYAIVPEILDAGEWVNALILMRKGPDYELVLVDTEDDYPNRIYVTAGGKKFEMTGGPKIWKTSISRAEMKKLMEDYALVVQSINDDNENMSLYGSAADMGLLAATGESPVAVDVITLKDANFDEAQFTATDGREFETDEETMIHLSQLLGDDGKKSKTPIDKDVVVFYTNSPEGLTVIRVNAPFLKKKAAQ